MTVRVDGPPGQTSLAAAARLLRRLSQVGYGVAPAKAGPMAADHAEFWAWVRHSRFADSGITILQRHRRVKTCTNMTAMDFA